MMASPPRFSVVFQGPLAPNFFVLRDNAAFLREHLKSVEILFSGWEGDLTAEQKDALDGIVLEQKDPGANYHDPITNVAHNAERQVRSTLAGIRVAKGVYVAKLRSDIAVRNLAFFQNLDERIRVIDIGTMDPAKMPYLFHVSDMAQIGPRAAMLDLWDHQRSL